MAMLLLTLLAPVAMAADVDTFDQAASLPGGAGSLQGEAPQLGQPGVSAALGIGLTSNPVVRSFEERPDRVEVTSLAPLTAHAGYTVEDVGRFDVILPVYAYVAAPLNGYQGAAAGDARLQATFELAGNDTVQFGLTPRLYLPTGATDALVSSGFAGGLVASLGNDTGDYGWLLNGGTTIRGAERLEVDAPGMGSTLDGLASGWWWASSGLRVGGELEAQVGLVQGEGSGGTNRTGTAHLFAQAVLPSGFGVAAGAGTGIVRGLGTPQAHGFAVLTYARLQRDSDGDGLLDNIDTCPGDPEDVDGFLDTDGCPDLDNDNDGILDAADQCTMQPEDIDGFADDDGCPDTDNDADGIADAADQCPLVPGPEAFGGCPDSDADGLPDSADACPQEAGPEATGGCPDRDSDLVPDHRDACPDEPKPEAEDPATSDGCPKTVFVGDGEITITERIEFETGAAVLTPESIPVLEKVAKVMTDHPEIELVEIQGHTDNVGSTASNIRLSDKRAKAVLAWLTGTGGIEKKRMAATGYGEGMPIDSNRTPGGRRNNRRVQFKLLRMAEAATPAPAPAPAPAPEKTLAPPAPVEPTGVDSPWGVVDEPEAPSPWDTPDADDAAPPAGDTPWGERADAPAPAPAPEAAPEEPVKEKRPPRKSKKR